MEYVPKLMNLTRTERRIRSDYQTALADWHGSGRPPRDLSSYKLEFGTELLMERPPTAVVESATIPADHPLFKAHVERPMGEDRPLQRRAFHVAEMATFGSFVPVLSSSDVTIRVCNGDFGEAGKWQPAARHADCHELYFVHLAEHPLRLITDFGLIEEIREGDFVFLPRGTTYSFLLTGRVSILLYEIPKRLCRPYDYWMGDQQPWPFSPAAPIPPEPTPLAALHPPLGNDEATQVVVKRRRGSLTLLTYAAPVFDAVAWEGEVWPFILRLDDLVALSSPHVHLDPKKLTVFVSEDEGMAMQVFLPRWIHSLPYHHLNWVDEALFNHKAYGVRPEITDGFMTFHPAGLAHGPDLRLLADIAREEASRPKDLPFRDEIAVMVESRSPFDILKDTEKVELKGYDQSWYRQSMENT
ncbi:MAG: homogentisate 1,2-dioxygenase [Candidatus Methylomirabilis oxygeniifera]|uniref:Putative dioxygenase VC_1345 n=1 Tax=Methylomirabilis oxygeniifera TaxID=671143 RepID=D5MIA6_METO1|nr:MAG: homogentisate 1,2-dioxygenase [Candidatus Methylomirabilis oxyfera]CBE67256.1 putative dioxygenase VC_1345 [Candidatus Methylomirabilis oxyfera]